MAYTIEFKQKVVNELRSGKTITEVSDKYRIAPSTVFFWNKFMDSDDSRYKTYGHKGEKSFSDIRITIKKLQQENLDLKCRVTYLENQVKNLIATNDKIYKAFIK